MKGPCFRGTNRTGGREENWKLGGRGSEEIRKKINIKSGHTVTCDICFTRKKLLCTLGRSERFLEQNIPPIPY